MTRYEEKLSRIRAGDYRKGDFIIADAKDGDMGPALPACGPVRDDDGNIVRVRTRREFIDAICEIVAQDVVDIMLVSASNLELLMEREAFMGTAVKPAIRANDTTDIWVGRGARYAKFP